MAGLSTPSRDWTGAAYEGLTNRWWHQYRRRGFVPGDLYMDTFAPDWRARRDITRMWAATWRQRARPVLRSRRVRMPLLNPRYVPRNRLANPWPFVEVLDPFWDPSVE